MSLNDKAIDLLTELFLVLNELDLDEEFHLSANNILARRIRVRDGLLPFRIDQMSASNEEQEDMFDDQ